MPLPAAGWCILLPVQIGTSLILIAAGAVLKYAVETQVSGVDLQVVGVILMIVGILGLAISLLQLALVEKRVSDE